MVPRNDPARGLHSGKGIYYLGGGFLAMRWHDACRPSIGTALPGSSWRCHLLPLKLAETHVPF